MDALKEEIKQLLLEIDREQSSGVKFMLQRELNNAFAELGKLVYLESK